MALVLADRVRETTTVTGTGTATLLGAAPGYQSFSAVGNANTTYYVIANQSATEWEVGIGTYTASGTTLSRDTVLASSNGGSLVNFSAGTKDVFVDYPAGKAVYEDAAGNVDGYPITGGTINNTTVGATTPSTGVFTTLTAQTEVLKGTGQNLVGYSQAFDDSSWTKSNSSITANSTTAPDGTTTADTLVENTANSTHYLYASANPALYATIVTGITYTSSIYVKPSGRNRIRFSGDGSSGFLGGDVIFDVLNGTVGSIPSGVTSASIVSAGNGWYRCIVVAVATGVVSRPIVFLDNGTTTTYTGDGASGVFVWGVQVEIGSTVNSYVATTPTKVYGTPTLSFSGVASIGLQSDGSLYETSAGTGNVRFYTNNIAQEQARVSHTASAVNAINLTGGATTKGVIQSAIGSDSNISYVTQSKGTGAIDLAAGSSGVNISNGGTVTAITRTAAGSGYTSIPSVAISAPTTAGGVQSTATAIVQIRNTSGVTINSGGTGYTVNDVLTVSGGTGAAATFTVATVSGGVITSITLLTSGGYSALPTFPASVTGGTGSSATFTFTDMSVSATPVTITNAGSGYVEQPTVTFSGGGGSGAAAYATVGSGVSLKALGSTFNVYVDNSTGRAFQFYNSGGTTDNFWSAASGGSAPFLYAQGSANTSGRITSNGTGSISIYTNGGGQQQLNVAHTASAVNYVQVTGGSTGSGPTISSQGSDANARLLLNAKGTSSGIDLLMNNSRQMFIGTNGSAVNYFQTGGSVAGVGLVLSAQGSDTNINAVVQPKGTGALQAQQTDSTATGGNARGANAVDWQTLRDFAVKVASGVSSFLGGGQYNQASGGQSVTVGGNNVVTSGSKAVSVGGDTNTNAAQLAFLGGGYTQTLSSNGQFGFLGGGYANTLAGFYNVIGGGYTNSGTSGSAVTTQSSTMNGTTAVTLSGSNASIKVGQLITGTSITTFPHTYVAAISGTSLTLSQVASGSGTSTLSFYTPHGVVVGGGNNQATGSYSFIGGGGDAGTAANRNVASGDYAVVSGGWRNVSSGNGSFIGGGGYLSGSVFGNTASGQNSIVVGGANNTNNAQQAFIGGGFGNLASGQNSAILGSNYGTTRGIDSLNVFSASNGPIGSGVGVQQSGLLVLGVQTTDATATVLRSNSSAASTTNQVILPNNSAYAFRGTVIANVTGGGNTKAWSIEGAIKRGANAASTALVGTPTVTSAYADVGAATWAITATADTTNGGLAITFTGQAGTTIRVVAKLETTEVTF